jgi:uncharacterized coiled-coil DUF342 family protein
MNKDRRNQIAEVAAKLADLEALRDEIKEAIENIRDEEQEYFDNMPEGLQQSDRGYAAEEAISQLDEAVSALEDLDTMGIAGNLEEAQA